ncbi:MAG TPA: 4Fe-4S binding protein, partial [Geobacteraceae bacterium]|nr:4Fe-4S binding protein [Geobacteraceae bacterium]
WEIDRLKCCICNLCVEVCPTKCLSTDNQYASAVTDRQMGTHKATFSVSTPPGAAPGDERNSRGDL